MDSILQLRELANDDSRPLNDKLEFAKKAYELSKNIKVDSTILKSGRDLSYMYVINADYENYKFYNIAVKLWLIAYNSYLSDPVYCYNYIAMLWITEKWDIQKYWNINLFEKYYWSHDFWMAFP